jgi:hypothetical protein
VIIGEQHSGRSHKNPSRADFLAIHGGANSLNLLPQK